MNFVPEQTDPGERSTARLYRAALGEASAGRYLPVFARFDDRGMAGPSWNSAAALFHLGWLVHHRLWGPLAGCAALAAAVSLALAGLWQLAPAWPTGIKLGISLALVLGAMLLPGLWGTAWLHTRSRRRMIAAVERAATVDGACITLGAEARDRQRRNTWGLAGLLSAGVLAALLWQTVPWSTFAGDTRADVSAPPTEPVAQASPSSVVPAVADAVKPLTVATSPVDTIRAGISEVQAPAPVPAPAVAEVRPEPASPADPPAVQPATRSSTPVADPVAVPTPKAVTPPVVSGATAKVRASSSASSPAVPVATDESPPAAPRPAPPKSGPASAKALPQPVPGKPVVQAAESASPPEPAVQAPGPVASGPSTPATATATNDIRPRVKGFGVAVGMFAVADNAERVAAQLSRAGLPVLSDPVESARGRLIRVRVGPFERRDQADAAAVRVRALGLEARVYVP